MAFEKPFDRAKSDKQERIDKIVAEEMEKVRRRRQRDNFWKYLTIGYLIFALSIYGIIFAGPKVFFESREMYVRGGVMLILLILIIASPRAASWIVGIEKREKRRKEFKP